MNILLACQKSGQLRELLLEQGHNAYTCDIAPSEDGSPWHIQDDALLHIYDRRYDCLIAMPECRNLSSSGQHRTGKPGQRTQKDVDAAIGFFMAMATSPIKHKCIENSIGIMSTLYRKPDQIVHPYWFGDDASKSTCLWFTDFPKLERHRCLFAYPRMVCDGCGRTSDWSIDYGLYPPRPQPCDLCHGKIKPRWANQTDSGQNRLGPSPTRSADRARTFPGIARAFADAVSRIK